MARSAHSETNPSLPAPHSPARRGFIWSLVAALVGLVVAIFPLGAGLLVFLDPLRAKRKVPGKYDAGEDAAEGFLKIAPLEAVPDDGVPRRFPVIANLSDAWNFSPGQPVGAVYLLRNKGEKSVEVFHATCPHAGCSVAYTSDPDPKKCLFKCPCHNSAFDIEGKRVNLPGKENPSPRPMDTLEVHEEKLAQAGEVWVKFQNFYTGIHEKKPKL